MDIHLSQYIILNHVFSLPLRYRFLLICTVSNSQASAIDFNLFYFISNFSYGT